MIGCSRLQPRVLVLAALLATFWPASASAEWFLSPFIGAKFAGSTNILLDLDQGASNTRMTLGVSFLVLSDDLLGLEGEFGYSPRFFERSSGTLTARSNVTTLMGNVVVALPKSITRDALRPYVVGGLGLVHVGIKDIISVSPVDGNLLGMALGGGAIGRLTNRTSVRFDLRHIRNIGRDDNVRSLGDTRISYWRATAGIAFSGRLF